MLYIKDQHIKSKIYRIIEAIETSSLFFFFVLLPLLFSPSFTNPYILPKQILLTLVTVILLLTFTLKISIYPKAISKDFTNLPLLLLIITLGFSTLFSANKFDSILQYVIFLILAIFFLLLKTLLTNKNFLFLITWGIFSGAILESSIILLRLLHLPGLPFQNVAISSFGSFIDQFLYLISAFLCGLFLADTAFRKSNVKQMIILFICLGTIMGAVITTIYVGINNPPIILPLDMGIQIALASLSHNVGNFWEHFFFGSGLGTFPNDFLQYRPPALNMNESFWALKGAVQSSFVVEFITTTGIIGFFTFILLILSLLKRAKAYYRNYFFIAFSLISISCFILPLSFSSVLLLFIFIALTLARLSQTDIFDEHAKNNSSEYSFYSISGASRIITLTLSYAFIGFISYFGTRFIFSDLLFQQSLVAASKNNGIATYQKQAAAIAEYPYRDIYYRSFSQTNLALASSLSLLQTTRKESSKAINKNMYTLIQQSIDSGKMSTLISPKTASNWQNIANIYRNLIDGSNNADKFALVYMKEAILLDPSDPEKYIELGGIYYQMTDYTNAIEAFTRAIERKNNYANAYYNLGHAYEEKGLYQEALTQYIIVKQLSLNSAINKEKISEDIRRLQEKKVKAKNTPTSAPIQPLPISKNSGEDGLSLPQNSIKLPIKN